jgi:hypothetical protein
LAKRFPTFVMGKIEVANANLLITDGSDVRRWGRIMSAYPQTSSAANRDIAGTNNSLRPHRAIGQIVSSAPRSQVNRCRRFLPEPAGDDLPSPYSGGVSCLV